MKKKGLTFPVVSDWEGLFIGPTATAILRYNPAYEIHLSGAFWAADTDTETWHLNGDFVQENDLEVVGFEWGAAVVRNFKLEENLVSSMRLGPSIVFETYSRDNFIFFTNDSVSGTDSSKVDENVFFASINLGLNVRARLSENNGLEWDAELGYIAIDQADNDVIPETIEGSGGISLKSSLLVHHKIKANQELGAGLIFTGRTLDGETTTQFIQGRSSPVEWPENELIQLGFQVFWKGTSDSP